MTAKISRYVLLVMLAAAVVIAGLFFASLAFGWNEEALVGDNVVPTYTSSLIYLMYSFVIIATILVLADAVFGFVRKAMANPKNALRSLIGVGLLAVLLLATFLFSNGGQVNVLGLDNPPSQTELRLVDMQLYTVYILLGVSVVAMLFGGFVKKIK